MPFKKYISIIIKIMIVFFSFYFIYHQLSENKSFEELDLTMLINTVKQNNLSLIGIILMMLLNWLFEALKWRYMISKIETISVIRAYRAVFTGITVSTFTPNRIGEYGGRVFCLEKGDRIKAVFITILCSMSQLLTTILFGSISLFILFEEILIEKSYISISLLILLNLFLVISYFNISSIVTFLSKLKLIKSFKQYLEVLAMYDYKDLTIAFIFSNIRYFIFSLQFIILLNIFEVDITFLNAPIGDVYPEDELPINERTLKGFTWRKKERPETLNDLFDKNDKEDQFPSILKFKYPEKDVGITPGN